MASDTTTNTDTAPNTYAPPATPKAPPPRGVARAVKVVDPYGKEALGELPVEEFDADTRTARAVKRLAVFWVLAIVSIAIPFLHFFLVPAFFLAGPIAAWLASRNTAVQHGGTIPCPCGATINVEPGPADFPIGARCKECRNILTVVAAD